MPIAKLPNLDADLKVERTSVNLAVFGKILTQRVGFLNDDSSGHDRLYNTRWYRIFKFHDNGEIRDHGKGTGYKLIGIHLLSRS
ncbi:hypothetical protein DM860_011524 [Cuscuta australis]|uniref:Uncharacterized protein n=1 Tax=Cuscuta australis TaxID=267555 RepID=A0A328D388_9ASTE|nr:hypothetical protein DM860_011524 [Cuscuta australis]